MLGPLSEPVGGATQTGRDGPTLGGRGAQRPPRPVLRLVGIRIPLGALSILVVAVLTYLATHVLPGDAATAILGQSATPARLARLRAQLDLNEALLPGLWHWLSGFVQGQFGESLVQHQGVASLILPRLANSAVLIVIVALIGTALGVVSGVYAAHRRDGVVDSVMSLTALVASAIPDFVVAVLVVAVFAVGVFHWFPAVAVLQPGQYIWDAPNNLVLPVASLVIVTTPYMFRMVRATTIDALDSDYAEVAQLKGVSLRRLLFMHALPNATPPAVQVLGLNLLYLAGGIVLVETVFQYPGIGLELVQGVQGRDIPIIQFAVVILAVIYVSVNILTDAVVLAVTPRRRYPR